MGSANSQHLLDKDAVGRNESRTRRIGSPNARKAATKSYAITVELQNEGVYLASSEDIKGLVLQTDTLDEMEAEFRECVPWLLEGNHDVHVSPEDLRIQRNGKCSASKVTYTISHE